MFQTQLECSRLTLASMSKSPSYSCALICLLSLESLVRRLPACVIPLGLKETILKTTNLRLSKYRISLEEPTMTTRLTVRVQSRRSNTRSQHRPPPPQTPPSPPTLLPPLPPKDPNPNKLPKPVFPWERSFYLPPLCRDGNGGATSTAFITQAPSSFPITHVCQVCRRSSRDLETSLYCDNCGFRVCESCADGIEGGGLHDDVRLGRGWDGEGASSEIESNSGSDSDSDDSSIWGDFGGSGQRGRGELVIRARLPQREDE